MIKSNNRLSQKFRVILIIIGVLLVIANLFMVDYKQLVSRENLGEALGILSNLLLISAMVISLKYTAQKRDNN